MYKIKPNLVTGGVNRAVGYTSSKSVFSEIPRQIEKYAAFVQYMTILGGAAAHWERSHELIYTTCVFIHFDLVFSSRGYCFTLIGAI